jgi:ParB-like chromosome segregation protein Spo0J
MSNSSSRLGRRRNARVAAIVAGDDDAVIVGNEARLRAHRQLANMGDDVGMILQVQGPSPIDEARAYKAALDARNVTMAELARELRLDRRRVSEKLAFLSLPPSVQNLFATHPHTFGESHARLFAPWSCRTWVEPLAHRCAEEGWSIQELRRAIDQAAHREAVSTGRPARFRRTGFTLVVRPQSAQALSQTIAELVTLLRDLRSNVASTSFGGAADAHGNWASPPTSASANDEQDTSNGSVRGPHQRGKEGYTNRP